VLLMLRSLQFIYLKLNLIFTEDFTRNYKMENTYNLEMMGGVNVMCNAREYSRQRNHFVLCKEAVNNNAVNRIK
jgi:hypothetical protein